MVDKDKPHGGSGTGTPSGTIHTGDEAPQASAAGGAGVDASEMKEVLIKM
tara:strand:- start:162 stop:311 length:150 start_codon:yes stop_codon:yes gene_type:complete